MCSRGIYQLSKLSVYFCDFGGSSNGVRNLIISSKWKQFLNNNSQINFNFICKRNHHPYLHGEYINGYQKNIPVRNLSEEDVLQFALGLKNQLGRSSFLASGTRVFGAIKSIQGQWQANLFNKYPMAEFEKSHKIPWAKVEAKQKLVINQQILKERDQSNRSLKLRKISSGNFVSNKGSQL